MPANPKYLKTSIGQRLLKFIAGLLGGYFVAVILHLVIAKLLPSHFTVMISGNFSICMVWVACMIPPYMVRNAWRIMGYYTFAILLGLLILYI